MASSPSPSFVIWPDRLYDYFLWFDSPLQPGPILLALAVAFDGRVVPYRGSLAGWRNFWAQTNMIGPYIIQLVHGVRILQENARDMYIYICVCDIYGICANVCVWVIIFVCIYIYIFIFIYIYIYYLYINKKSVPRTDGKVPSLESQFGLQVLALLIHLSYVLVLAVNPAKIPFLDVIGSRICCKCHVNTVIRWTSSTCPEWGATQTCNFHGGKWW